MALIELPEVDYVSDDVTSTLNDMIMFVELLLNRKLYPGDPLRIFLQTMAALIVQQRTLINLTAKATLLRYAPGDVLDHIGELTETSRLQATAAETLIQFTLSAPQSSAIVIPKGTRVSSATDPKRYFETNAHAEVLPGQTTATVWATCTEVGSAGNGYMPGQITEMVDLVAFVASAWNLTESAGGSDTEGDDAYRERIRTAPEAFSVAGPTGAYQYLAKSASSSIIDVSVNSPSAGHIHIVPLLSGGEIPGVEILEKVLAIVSDKRSRPLTDYVSVGVPEAVQYDVLLQYWIAEDQAANLANIRAAVDVAVNDFVLWQKSKLGRSINPSELIRRVMTAGASRVNVINPSFTPLADTKFAVAGTVFASFEGLTNE